MVTSRPFACSDDYERMRRLVTDIYAQSGPPAYCTLGELDWWRFSGEPRIAEQAQLWVDDDRLVGFAWPSHGQVDLVAHPAHAFIQDEMLAWAEARRRRTHPDDDRPRTLTAWAFEHDHERQSLLIDRGYERAEFVLCYRARRLMTSIGLPPLPPGYTLDHMDEDTVESRVAAHRDAFGSTRMTVAKYRTIMQAPTYRQDLDLIVRDPEGAVAAFALVWFDESSRQGTFEPVGTRAEYQRRGLSRALMIDGMNRLQSLGADTACVVSGGDEEAANRLYEAVGMPLAGRNVAWKKQLRG